jgi:hypothetical protein
MHRAYPLTGLVSALALTWTAHVYAEDAAAPPAETGEQSEEALAKKTQNPVSDLVSIPFQNNTNFGFAGGTQNVLNVQPVVPISLSDDWLLINRAIFPIIWQPETVPGAGADFGLGDATYSAFFSPQGSPDFIWGAGPILLLPTATSDSLAFGGEFGAGPTAVALTMQGPWVIGALGSQAWSFDGDVSFTSLQPFINYNIPGGWFLVTAPLITANWKADADNTWTIPVGGGFGKVLKLGVPFNVGAQAYWNAMKPDIGPDWSLRLVISVLLPR